MVRHRYVGVTDPRAAFTDLAPLREKLIRLQGRVRPFGPDYLILEAVKKALDTAAHHFTGDPRFFALKPEQNAAPERAPVPR